MHPAKSMIIFTTLSGMGFGLIAVLGIGAEELSSHAHMCAMIIAMIFTVVGLIAATFHLGHPERAWRAMSQWRSSWLSREGVFSIITLGLFSLNILMFYRNGATISWLEPIVSLFALLTVFATSMIYASIKAVPRWSSPATCWGFMWFAFASGTLLYLVISAHDGLGRDLAPIVAGVIATSWVVKFASWWVGDRNPGPSSPESATGLGHLGDVRLLESPHSVANYLLNEMVFQIGRKHRTKLRWIAVLLGGIIPTIFVLLFAFGQGNFWIYLALIIHLVGMFTERWLFFAEADHVVRHFYGHR